MESSVYQINNSVKRMAFLLCLCALWACKEQKTTNQMANCCHQINIENSQKYNPIDSAIKHVQVIPLQTDSIALIEYIDRIEMDEQYIFILDVNNNFFIFRMNGEFVAKIAASGRGPKDITRLRNFYIDTYKKRICIFDDIRQSIFKYNYEGEFIDRVPCKEPVCNSVLEMQMLSENEVFLTLSYDPEITSSYALIDATTYSLQEKLLPYPYHWQLSCTDGNFPKQCRHWSGHYAVHLLSDTLYKYENRQFVPWLAFQSGKKPFTGLKPKTVKDYGDLVSYAHSHKLSTGIQRVLMTDSIGYTDLFYDGNNNHVFWNLNTFKTVYTPLFGGYPNALKDFNVCSATKDYFIGFILPSQINLEVLQKECSAEVVEKLSHVRMDDNPVLVFYPIFF